MMLLSHNERCVEDLFRAKKKKESVANVCGSSWKTKNKLNFKHFVKCFAPSETEGSALQSALMRGEQLAVVCMDRDDQDFQMLH